MPSSQPFIPSSPLSTTHHHHPKRKSRFTYKHLSTLASSSPTSPLRCIALIDYDAFYAQCEQVRLSIPPTQPLAVQQWQGLIAINYPARAFGLTRHITATEAKTKCPDLVVQHVATWREGDDKWAYRGADAAKYIQTDKVSLDPYRLESRKSLALIKEILPAPPVQRVEKASIDEVFLDLSAQIHQVLVQRYPELRHAPYDDPTENLPLPPSTALDWQADALVDLDSAETEDDDPDWDDVVMNIGSEIVRGVRNTIFERLKYTCSAGIARNKMMAKLGAGYKKPNQQTIVRNRAVQHFLSGFKFTKIRNLGGKLGDQIVEAFGTDEVTELLNISLEQMKSKFGDDTGTWLYGVIRGEDLSEVNARTQIKSMLSAKSFRPSINTMEQGNRWLRIFVADIYSRLVEEGVVENKRRPKTITLHHRQGGQTRSKQLPIPQGKGIDEVTLFELAKTLLGQVVVDGRAWPCANLSLSVGGFEDGVAGNKGIDVFLLKGEEARAAMDVPSRSTTATPIHDERRPEKRRRLDDAPSITHFFSKGESTGDGEDISVDEGLDDHANEDDDGNRSHLEVSHQAPQHQTDIATYFCKSCQRSIDEADRHEHEDWHFAKELQAQDTPAVVGPSNSRPPGTAHSKPKRGAVSARGRGAKPEKGQSRLAFG
jgi:DNA polymerase eta